MFDFVRKYGPRGLALVAITAAAIAAAPADAQGHGGFHGGGGWHGGGYHHGGGWGWGVGVGFYDPWWPGYYGAGPYGYYPYYGYGEAPVTVIEQPMVGAQQQVQQAPAPATYYYCDDPAGYYPYVQNCGKPWRAVPAVPQGATPPPQ